MDYLVIEGYKEAAENFARESGMNTNNHQMDFDSIQNRMIIRNAIQSGDIVEAIERVNDFDPEVGDLFFSFAFPPLPSALPCVLYRVHLATIITQCTTLRLSCTLPLSRASSLCPLQRVHLGWHASLACISAEDEVKDTTNFVVYEHLLLSPFITHA